MKNFARVKDFKALPDYKIWLSFTDGSQGEIDFSDKVGKGVFKFWEDFGNFSKVKLSEDQRSLTWNEDLDLCADSLYLKLTGKRPEELYQ